MCSIPDEVWFLIFKYLKNIDLIEMSAVCKQWNSIVKTNSRLSLKLEENNEIFLIKIGLLNCTKKSSLLSRRNLLGGNKFIKQ